LVADSTLAVHAATNTEVQGMHTVELLQEALEAARGLGYDVRQDWLGGDGGGHCLVRGRRMLLLDVAQTPDEQLDVVADALRGEGRTGSLKISRKLAERLSAHAA
jgi:hypothetical protein